MKWVGLSEVNEEINSLDDFLEKYGKKNDYASRLLKDRLLHLAVLKSQLECGGIFKSK